MALSELFIRDKKTSHEIENETLWVVKFQGTNTIRSSVAAP